MDNTKITYESNKLQLINSSTVNNFNIVEHQYRFIWDPSIQANLQAISQFPLENRPFLHFHMERQNLGIAGIWRPDSGFQKNLLGDWSQLHQINLSHSAPVVCFFDQDGLNCFTVSLSEVTRDVYLLAGVHEETGEIYIDAIIYLPEQINTFDFTCRIDFSNRHFDQVLKDVSAWWDTILPDDPMLVPNDAFLPMYSTWYSYHQNITDSSLTAEYKLASELGMKAVIIDDGWQTADNNRGYGYCGDWNAESSKFPDFKKHIDFIHSLGMKCLLWYSVPFVGEYSSMWSHFSNMLLHYDDVLHTGVLDPRYPEVRNYLISVYKKASQEWNLDGFKLDFIDSFRDYPDTPLYNNSMDYCEIQEAVYHLMLDISQSLRNINPNLLVEFRQNYIGPQMRRFGNIFRVGDCPLSGITNRIGITDLKLLTGTSAIHSDMIMWNKNESPEDVAIQLINCIFATLQISVKLNLLTEKQYAVLKHYLDFSISYRHILQHGDFAAHAPLALYPILQGFSNDTCITACYDTKRLIHLSTDDTIREFWLLNGTKGTQFSITINQKGLYKVSSYDCTGELTTAKIEEFAYGHYFIPTTPGGSINITLL